MGKKKLQAKQNRCVEKSRLKINQIVFRVEKDFFTTTWGMGKKIAS